MKQTFEIPEGCTRVTIEQQDNQIITTFEPEVKFKDGDILAAENKIYILRGNDRKINSYRTIYLLLDIRKNQIFTSYSICEFHGIIDKYDHLATESEKQQLFDALAEVGKKWNAEKKCIEELKPERWMAEKKEPYWYLNENFVARATPDDNYQIDNRRYQAGNYFQTEQQAKDFAERIKQLPR